MSLDLKRRVKHFLQVSLDSTTVAGLICLSDYWLFANWLKVFDATCGFPDSLLTVTVLTFTNEECPRQSSAQEHAFTNAVKL